MYREFFFKKYTNNEQQLNAIFHSCNNLSQDVYMIHIPVNLADVLMAAFDP